MHRSFLPILCSLALIHLDGRAEGPADNRADQVRPVPPPGIEIPDADRQELRAAAEGLRMAMDQFAESAPAGSEALRLLPDVEVFHKAVDWALRFDEFYSTNQIRIAHQLLELGNERLNWLKNGHAPWTKATGLVVRGYRSKIDGSIQPYGMVVPESFAVSPAVPHRLDFWFHGRGEKLTELDFLSQRQKDPGPFTPPNTFVLHLYGRYCNANKFAGEVDLFEALESAKASYPIDEDRLVVRGFSMGGASCWQFAVHYPGLWAAAAPGAGFSETPEFLNVFQNETLEPTWWEQKLWHLYNATDYAVNLFNCPTVAYSGEKDKQMQAALAMEKAMAEEGMRLEHIIGPEMGHKYDDGSRKLIDERIDRIAARGRDPLPREIKFTTWTLRYNEMSWVTLEGLEQHWERARVNARILGDSKIEIETTNLTHLKLEMPAGLSPLDATRLPEIELDGQSLTGGPVMSDRSWHSRFRKVDGRWETYEPEQDIAGRKRPGLQGPIDDAFMDRFLIVRPTGQPLNEAAGRWAEAELAHAVDHWRRQFRGELEVVNDVDVTKEQIEETNLILFGDPRSNQLLKKIYDVFPVVWGPDKVRAAGREFSSENHALALIYPNPLNPKRYVVVNSGFTFREYDYLNNARQVPKLPDWAVIDISVPVTSRTPGEMAAAGFFDERWQMPK